MKFKNDIVKNYIIAQSTYKGFSFKISFKIVCVHACVCANECAGAKEAQRLPGSWSYRHL